MRLFAKKSSPSKSISSPAAVRAATVEPLECRKLMSVVLALQPKNVLLSVDSANPAEVLATTKVKGLAKKESLVGIDFRPATGELFGVGNSNQLYRIDLTGGTATKVGGPFSTALVGTQFGADFNPVVDRLRVVSDSDQNFRVNPDDGAVIDTDPDAGTQTDANLAFAPTDPNVAVDPTIVRAAYSNNVGGAPSTALYAIDANLNALVTIGSADGTVSPNSGQVFTVGALGIDPLSVGGFDVSTVNGADTAYAAFRTDARQPSQLYTVNLATGGVAAGGNIGKKRAETLDIAVAPVGVNFIAVTAKNQLLTLNTAVPHLIIGELKINGLAGKEKIAGIDFRPATSGLYAITTADQLYTINTSTGVATPLGSTWAVDTDGRAEFGFDFNPAADAARVVNTSDQNVRIDPNTGGVIDFNSNADGIQGDTNLAYIAGDPRQGTNPTVVGLAYSNNVAGGTPTTAYAIDAGTNSLVTIGSPTGSPTPPTTGQLITVGALGVNVNEIAGFDIRTTGGGDVAYATFLTDNKRDGLYTVNLGSGAATFLGGLNKKAKAVRDIAMVPN
jgi:hypothetical protein